MYSRLFPSQSFPEGILSLPFISCRLSHSISSLTLLYRVSWFRRNECYSYSHLFSFHCHWQWWSSSSVKKGLIISLEVLGIDKPVRSKGNKSIQRQEQNREVKRDWDSIHSSFSSEERMIGCLLQRLSMLVFCISPLVYTAIASWFLCGWQWIIDAFQSLRQEGGREEGGWVQEDENASVKTSDTREQQPDSEEEERLSRETMMVHLQKGNIRRDGMKTKEREWEWNSL